MTILDQVELEKALKIFGATEKEAQVYIFLAKRGIQKTDYIAKQTKTNRGLVYRILKNLQEKGLVQSTLEYPVRYAAVPLQKVVDAFIKSRKEEVAQIEEEKSDLISTWNRISLSEIESPIEKFSVIKGNKRIFSKITELINGAKKQVSVVADFSILLKADRFGVFDAALNHPLKSQIEFRFLTESTEQGLNSTKAFFKGIPKTAINFTARNPNLGLQPSPRMIIRDNTEILFFTTSPKADEERKEEACLCTNCKTLVQTFMAVFEDLWCNSTKIQTNTVDTATIKPKLEISIIKDAEIAHKKYFDVLRSAKKEVTIMTSSKGIIRIWENMPLVKATAEKRVSMRILAPVISDNVKEVQELSKFCEVKHVSASYLGTTIVDGEHLFQFEESPKKESSEIMTHFENTFYTNDLEYVKKTERMLQSIWKNAYNPSVVTLDSILENAGPALAPFSRRVRDYASKVDGYIHIDDKLQRSITEKDVLNKIIHAEEYPAEISSIDRMYATVGLAVVHPPNFFKLPDMIFMVFHVEKQSTFGEGDQMIVYLWLKTPRGHNYVPVAIINDNPGSQNLLKIVYDGTPAGQNIKLIGKNEIQVRTHGNSLFAGWTLPIPLYPKKLTLPPACIQIEGYGDIKTASYTLVNPSGYKQLIEENYLDAFVTFFHPSSKYSGPGTDGFFIRDFVTTTYPPSSVPR